MRRGLYILLALLLSTAMDAQKRSNAKITNLGDFDTRTYHFGVQLSYNTADFFVQQRLDPSFQDSILTLQHVSQPGFNIAIIGSLNLTKNLSIRLIPGISPKERILDYTILDEQGRSIAYRKTVSSFYIDVPVIFKYRTDRINNFAAYLIGGAEWSRDMASQEKVNNNSAGVNEQVVKIKRNDYLAAFGGGFDFFLPYFKFGIELKMNIGFDNILLDDGTVFSRNLESLRSRNFVLSLTFEG